VPPPWHIGLLVSDIDQAVVELADSLGTSFTPTATVHFERVEDPEPRSIDIRVSFSRGPGPQLEVIEDVAGVGIYSIRSHGPGLHHLGYWEDQIDAMYRTRLEAGTVSVARVVGPDGGLMAWYGTTPQSPGVLLEFINAEARAAIEAFVATGDPSHLG
jgi:hypothetical protein